MSLCVCSLHHFDVTVRLWADSVNIVDLQNIFSFISHQVHDNMNTSHLVLFARHTDFPKNFNCLLNGSYLHVYAFYCVIYLNFPCVNVPLIPHCSHHYNTDMCIMLCVIHCSLLQCVYVTYISNNIYSALSQKLQTRLSLNVIAISFC